MKSLICLIATHPPSQHKELPAMWAVPGATCPDRGRPQICAHGLRIHGESIKSMAVGMFWRRCCSIHRLWAALEHFPTSSNCGTTSWLCPSKPLRSCARTDQTGPDRLQRTAVESADWSFTGLSQVKRSLSSEKKLERTSPEK